MATTNGNHPLSTLDVLTLAEAAAYLKLPEETVRTEADAGRLVGRAVGDDWRFVRVDVLAWVRPSQKDRIRAVIGGWQGDPTVDPMLVRIEADRRVEPAVLTGAELVAHAQAVKAMYGFTETDEEVEAFIAEIYAARRALGTVGDHFPDEGDENPTADLAHSIPS